MDFEKARRTMVDQQLIPRGIKDKKVLEAFYKVERHRFISADSSALAYRDFPVSIGHGQTMSQPYIVALMTECLQLNKSDKVLEIGTGSGYQGAIIAELVNTIYSIERIPELAKKSRENLDQLGYTNVEISVGDGTLGLAQFAPYDAIMVTAASPDVPKPLIEQLNDGGKLVIPVGESIGQVLRLITKKGNQIIERNICGCVFVPLIGEYGFK